MFYPGSSSHDLVKGPICVTFSELKTWTPFGNQSKVSLKKLDSDEFVMHGFIQMARKIETKTSNNNKLPNKNQQKHLWWYCVRLGVLDFVSFCCAIVLQTPKKLKPTTCKKGLHQQKLETGPTPKKTRVGQWKPFHFKRTRAKRTLGFGFGAGDPPSASKSSDSALPSPTLWRVGSQTGSEWSRCFYVEGWIAAISRFKVRFSFWKRLSKIWCIFLQGVFFNFLGSRENKASKLNFKKMQNQKKNIPWAQPLLFVNSHPKSQQNQPQTMTLSCMFSSTW